MRKTRGFIGVSLANIKYCLVYDFHGILLQLEHPVGASSSNPFTIPFIQDQLRATDGLLILDNGLLMASLALRPDSD